MAYLKNVIPVFIILFVVLEMPHITSGEFTLSRRNVDKTMIESFGSAELSLRTQPAPSAACATPDKLPGRCILMSQCPVYIPLVESLKEPQVSAFVRRTICRMERNLLLICCPVDPRQATLPISTTQQPTTTSPVVTVLQQSPPQTTTPVGINFGSNSASSSQNFPIGPTQNFPPPKLPSGQQPGQSRPSQTSTSAPRTSFNPNNGASGVEVPSAQDTQSLPPSNGFLGALPVPSGQNPLPVGPAPASGDPFPAFPTLPPRIFLDQPSSVPSAQEPVPTQDPSNGLSFPPEATQPDRMNAVEQDGGFTPTSASFFDSGSSLFIPSERECGIGNSLSDVPGHAEVSFPWLAAVGFARDNENFDVSCGCALITSRHVICAAHCLDLEKMGAGTPTHVRLGDYNLEDSSDVARPMDIPILRHQTPGYEAGSKKNDIAVVTLSQDVQFNDFVQPVCLPYRYRFDGFRYQTLNVVGWTHTLFIKGRGDLPQTPSTFNTPITGLSQCRKQYQEPSNSVAIDRSNLCATGTSPDNCLRDSGALGVYFDSDRTNRFFLVGVGSFGSGCDQPNAPYVFSRLGSHLDWIDQLLAQ